MKQICQLYFNKKIFAVTITFIILNSSIASLNAQIIDLGTLGGETVAAAINDSGQVTGYSYVGNIPHAFIWEDGVIQDLGILNNFPNDGGGGGGESFATALSNSGQIVGTFWTDDSYAFLWKDGVTTQLPPDTTWSRASAINNNNQIVGEAGSGFNGFNEAVYWQDGVFNSLNVQGNANGNNDLGQIVYYNGSNGGAYLWDNGSHILLGDASTGLTPFDINNSSQVVGLKSGSTSSNWFLWENGVLTTLPINGMALAINDSGDIVGRGPQNHAYLYRNGEAIDLNTMIDPSSGWVLNEAWGINNQNYVVGNGILNGNPRAFLLNTNFRIISPAADELWIAGETDSIKWTNGPDTVDIFISLDYENGSGTFLPIMLNYVVNERSYAINIPYEILSRTCCIRIQSSSDSTDRAESKIFKIKGYVLTRFRTDGSYEAFIPSEDGWSFGNDETNMWPPLWWVQFNYQSGFDPITGQPYPQEYFGSMRSYNFPDWPLFVEVFTTAKCYFNTSPSPVYKPSSIQRWKDIVSFTWSGACSGFSVSSLLSFCYEQDFLNQFPIGTYANLYDLQIDNFRRTVVNQLQKYYNGKEHTDYNNLRRNMTPRETLAELKELLKDEEINARYLYTADVNGSGAHALVPYQLVKESSSSGVYYVYVYDSNHPGDDSKSVILDSVANSWDYNDLGWSGNKGCRLMDEVSTYLQHPSLSPMLEKTPASTLIGQSYLQIYNTSEADILLTDLNGNSIGIQDSMVINTLPDGIPIIPITSRYQPPIGYYVPEDRYTIQLSSFTDSISRFSSFSDSTVFSFQRYEAQQNQTDKIILETNGMSLLNPDTQTKLSNFKTILIEDNEEKVFDILEYPSEQNDSAFFGVTSFDHLRLVNAGPEKNYTLKLHYATTIGQMRFYNSGVPIPANSAEEIIPDWNNLSQPVIVLVDLGIDGTIDDTLYLDNTVGVEDQGSLLSPNSYNLAQNFPNPFNPTTTIQFSLPQVGDVTLKIYNVLGEEVKTLVNEYKGIGNHSVQFNANSLASGMYLYRLQAGSFVETKKMILIK